ncbi:type II CRISPR RNA-guided endonuclease Cas9 [Companilactobacillus kedongensis]|uniref:type II CRISPR RNA-guided endonuclease Cas9 n=1 Tax=Companilactobacillus kedongensis TaxID=2486004 RepID=UPI000F76E94A|nr:type II CRISPR RNA-guided endonuclease Cas9 [Companilactobacillus kedongensis]
MDRKISLGLDIGVSSVGFSVIDPRAGKILELGSRLINGKIGEENQTRRSMRGARRSTNRKKQRRKDTAKLFNKFKLIDSKEDKNYFDHFDNNSNPYELRVKGLSERLNLSEIAVSLYHIVKRRGISYDLKDVDDESEGSDYAKSLQLNTKELKTQTPAQIQLDRLSKHGATRGTVVVDADEGEVLLNVFTTKAYIDEAKRIIEKQREFYPEVLTEEFEDAYCKILNRKRDYFKGPGSEKSRTDYGIYKEDGRKLENLFEELIGHDKIFPDELRASGASYTAQVFNVLNDLNNLRILSYEDQKLTENDKRQILSELKNNKTTVNMIKLIKKVADCDDSDIAGYRTDDKDKPEISSMEIYRKVHKKFLESDVDISDWSTDFLDRLSSILTLNTENGEIRKQLRNKLQPDFDFLTDDLIQLIIDNKASFNVTSNNKWHRLSVKTMKLLIPEMLKRPVEQMTLINEMGLIKDNGKKYSQYKYLPYKQIAQDIYNPVAAKSVREALKIVNAVLKEYGHIDYVVVEMPRDKNEDDAKKQIKDFQNKNKKQKDEALKEFTNSVGSKSLVDDGLRKYGSKLFFKIRLWYQQQKIDVYNGKVISASDLLNNPDNFEIDHIIPQSISFDDSINNKTLCYAEMNQIKGQKTPFEFMNEGHGQGFDSMKAMVIKNTRFNKNKRKNYLFSENVSDIDTRKRFISRNLVDTRYSSRVVLNSLQEFFREKEVNTKVTVIRGKFTSNMRKHWHINKTRETFHHHAIDASIIASTPFLNIWKKGASIFPVKVEGDNTVDIETGEIIDDKTFDKEVYEQPYNGFVDELMNADDRIKFSHQVDKKMNRKVSDSTIYSTRSGMLAKDKEESEYIVGKIKNIYDYKEYVRFKKICDKDKSKFLLNKYDPRSFNHLEEIMNTYPSSIEKMGRDNKVKTVDISPFELYRVDHGPVRKYSKKNNGPEIRQLKYLDKKIGSNIDITPENANNKHVILQSLNPWRTDVYLNHETGEYEIMGIKYADLKFNEDEGYGIKLKKYLEIKYRERVSDDSEFIFSLYKKDRIKVENLETGESVEMLFWSRTMDKQKGYVELKPIYKYKTDNDDWPVYGSAKKQIIKRLVPKNCKIWKVNTDILGNPFYLEKEGENPKDILD